MPNEKMNCFVDTNLLIYAVDPSYPDKRRRAADLLRRTIGNNTLVLSPQSLNECYRVITDKRQIAPREAAREFIAALRASCTAPSGYEVTETAWRIQDTTDFSWWDCTLLASALLGGCRYFLSEDMQHGRQVGDMTVANPFAPNFQLSI